MTQRNVSALPLAFCLMVMAVGCKTSPETGLGPPTVVAQEMVVAEQGLTDFRVRLEGKIHSPVPLKVEKARYEMVVEGKVVKQGELPMALTLAAGETKDFSIEGGSQYVSSAQELKDVSAKGGTLLTAIRGTLYGKSEAGTPHELTYARSREIRVPRMPTVKMHELDGARYSAEEVNAIFYLGVVNPNPFPIRINGLKYAVAMAGKPLTDGVLGKGEKVDPSATGVFEVHASFNKETYGADAPKVIKSTRLPYVITGELTGDLVQEPYELKGEMKLNVSK